MSFIENTIGGVTFMTASNIKAPHAFTTRYGGVSSGDYGTMNLSISPSGGDAQENVRKNFEILFSALDMPFDRLVYTKQVHGNDVEAVTENDITALFQPVPRGRDGLVTDVPELPVIAFTADCIPLLLWDSKTGAVGAVHAGWRGTVQDIAGSAVRKMADSYGSDPADIMCAIGPGISQCCFETDYDVPEAIISILGDRGSRYFEKRGDKYFPDIKGVNKALFMRAGIPEENIQVSDECTMCSHDKYWSHRYTHGVRGCQACVIMVRGN